MQRGITMKTIIKQWAEDNGKSMGWLSRQIGYTHSYTDGCANGTFKPSMKFRMKVAEVLELPVEELFDERGFARPFD
jgi:lambda repressor-like predicted transcriptional regulator